MTLASLRAPLPGPGVEPDDAFPQFLSLGLRNLHVAAGGDAATADALARAAALVGSAILAGEIAVDLEAAEDGAALRKAVLASPVVGKDSASGAFPLVLSGSRLYLARYWDYERAFHAALRTLNRRAEGVDEKALRALLDRFFPARGAPAPDWQRIAATTAVLRHLCIISGGPGTGKTTTVVKILAILLTLQPKLRIAIAAPTGKAAARVQESIRMQLKELELPAAVSAGMPAESHTIHRLLGYKHGSTRFRHDRDNPLPYDVVVVDEASMLDLALAAKLTGALHDKVRLILLGDKDQLSSVEAGAVYAGISGATAKESQLKDAVVWLEHSYRFGPGSALGKLARAINAGETAEVSRLLRCGDAHVTWTSELEAPRALAERLLAGYAPFVEAVRAGKPAGEIFASFDAYRVLCSTREGNYGSRRVGQWLVGALRQRLGVAPGQAWFVGRPVLVTANDYTMHLFNGDVGIVLPDASGESMLHFQAADGSTRVVSPMRLGTVEDALAITVHRSQGSEFERVAIVVDPAVVRGLSRPLIYTAVTRARSAVALHASEESLRAAWKDAVP